MNIGEKNTIQGPSTRNQGEKEYMRWQNLIEDESGVQCTVIVREHTLSIRARDYTDYVLARSVLRGRTSLEIVQG